MQAFMEQPCSHQQRSDRADIKALMKKPIGRDATAALLQALSTFEHGDHIEVQLKDGPKVSVVKASGRRTSDRARTVAASSLASSAATEFSTESPPESSPRPS